MAPKSVSGSKGKKPLIVSSPTKKRKSSIPEPSNSEGDVKTLLTKILGSVGELHQKTDLISTRLVLLEEKVKEQKKKEIIFIKQWEDKEEKENEGNDEVDEDEDKEEEEGAQGVKEEDEKENEENNEEDAEDDEEKEQDEGDDGKEDDEEEEEGEKEAATDFPSETESNLPAPSKGHRYGLRSRSNTKFSNTADQPIILTPSPSSSSSP